jgi:regulator of protease activity HflC (stomatin/prohibitin superfamily)
MDDKSKSEIKSYSRFVRNYAVAILVIVALMVCYFVMWAWKDFVFGKDNDLLGWVILLCLHPIIIVRALIEKKGQPVTPDASKAKAPEKTRTEQASLRKEKKKKVFQKMVAAIRPLFMVDLAAIILVGLPRFPFAKQFPYLQQFPFLLRLNDFLMWLVNHPDVMPFVLWFVILGYAGYFIFDTYFWSKRNGEKRGLYSSIWYSSVLVLGWIFGKWTGLIFFSAPLLIIYYVWLYWMATVIMPANNPDSKLVLFDKNNEKWQRFLLFLHYTWGIHYPMIVAEDEWGKEIATRIPGSPFQPRGAPGVILTRPHQVVGITSGTEFSRVEGPGLVLSRRFERPLEIVDLRRQVRISWVDALTKDGIQFKARLFMVFQVNVSSPDHTEGSFPYSKKWVRRLLKLAGVNPADQKTNIAWDKMVVQQIEQTAQQIISTRTLNELWQTQDSAKFPSAFVEIGDQIKTAVQSKLADRGITIYTTRMPFFKFSEEKEDSISDQQLKTWKSYWARQANETMAEGEAEAARLQDEAHAYAQSILLRALADGIKQTTPEISRYVIAIRFISAIQELMKRDPSLAEKVGSEKDSQFESIKQGMKPQ